MCDLDDPGVRWQVHLAQGIAWLDRHRSRGVGGVVPPGDRGRAGAGERGVFSRLWLNISNQRRGQDAGVPGRGVVRVPPEAVRRAVRETFEYADLDAIEIYGPPNPFAEQFVNHGLDGVQVTTYPRHTVGFTRLTEA